MDCVLVSGGVTLIASLNKRQMTHVLRLLAAILLFQFQVPARAEQWRCFINYKQYDCTVKWLGDTIELRTSYYEGQTLIFSMLNNGTYTFRNGSINSYGFWKAKNRNGLEFKSGEHESAPVIYLEPGHK